MTCCTFYHYTTPYKQLRLVSSSNHELSDPFTFTLLESKFFVGQKTRVWPLKQETNNQKKARTIVGNPLIPRKKQYKDTFKCFLKVHLDIILACLADSHWHQKQSSNATEHDYASILFWHRTQMKWRCHVKVCASVYRMVLLQVTCSSQMMHNTTVP